jgi:hypothetical protein
MRPIPELYQPRGNQPESRESFQTSPVERRAAYRRMSLLSRTAPSPAASKTLAEGSPVPSSEKASLNVSCVMPATPRLSRESNATSDRELAWLSTSFRKYNHVFRSNRFLTVAAPIRAARVSKRLSDCVPAAIWPVDVGPL